MIMPERSPSHSPKNDAPDRSPLRRSVAWLRRFTESFRPDSATGYAILAKLWQLLTGPVTQLILVISFSAATQDYYYAFSSLLGMQVFVELGLHVVIINLTSHEWSELSLHEGRIEGTSTARARLLSLGRMMLRWYAVAAVLLVLTLMTAGMLFFGSSSTAVLSRESVSWTAPWITLVLIQGCQLTLLPVTAILEGCHQLPAINRVRFLQAVAGTLTVWITLFAGFGLWAVVASALVRLAAELWLILGKYRAFMMQLFESPEGESMSWKREILPLQWRIAVQGVFLWLANQMPVLLIFRHWPEGEATRYGMTWTILTALQGAALAWVETKRPEFGSLVAQRKFSALDQLFLNQTKRSMAAMAMAVTTLCIVVWLLGMRSEWLFERLASRMLPASTTAVLALAMLLLQFALCVNLYVRAHNRDPFLPASLVSSLTISSLQVVLGLSYGTFGVAIGYLFGIACVQVPLWTAIWLRTRREWHVITQN